MPVYNAERHIEEAVDSILNQTFGEFEFIIIDDCSTDSSYELLQRFSEKDKRIKLYKNSKNSKISYTLNRSLSIASGKYVARMDADDIALPSRFEIQLKYLENNPETALVGASLFYIDGSNNPIGSRDSICGSSLINKIIEYRSPLAHPTWMFRKNVLEKIGGYREVVPAEDYDVLLRLHSAGIRFDNVPEKLLKYRISDGSTVLQAGLKQRKAFNYVLGLYRNKNYSSENGCSKASFVRHTKSTRMSENLFKASQIVFNKASRYKHGGSYILSIFLYFTACVLSIYQCQFIYRGFKSMKIIKKESLLK